MPLDTAVPDVNAFPAKASGLLVPAMGNQPPVRPDDPPPGQAVTGRQDVAHGPSGSRITGTSRHLPVADDLAPFQVADDSPDHLDKGVRPRAAHPMPVRPGSRRRHAGRP